MTTVRTKTRRLVVTSMLFTGVASATLGSLTRAGATRPQPSRNSPNTAVGRLLAGALDTASYESQLPPPPPPPPTTTTTTTAPPPPTTTTTPPTTVPSEPSGSWQSLVMSLSWNGSTMLRIAHCESTDNPDATNPSSGAHGLFQEEGITTDDPIQQVRDAYQLWQSQGYAAWDASSSCWD